MNEKQAIRRYAIEKRYRALVLLVISITAGLFGALLFPDFRWAAAIPGFSLCFVTGWAAFVLLSSTSKLVERQKADEIDVLFADPADTTPAVAVAPTEVEETSASVSFATVLAGVAILLVTIVGLMRPDVNSDKRNAIHNANQPDKMEHQKLPGFNLSQPEQQIMLGVISRGGRVHTDKERKNVLVIDFCSSQRVDDFLLEEYSSDLPAVQKIDLRHTPVTDSGVRHLARLSTLRQLRLGGTRVTPEQVAALRMSLPGCEIDTETAE